MGTKKEIMSRRADILTYLQQGVTRISIANQLNVSLNTIEKDLVALRTKRGLELQKRIGWHKLVDYGEAARLRIRAQWMIISDNNEPTRNKLMAYKLLQNEETMAIRRDQISGILPKDTESGMPPIITGDNSNVNVQHVNIYQTLLQLKQEEQRTATEARTETETETKNTIVVECKADEA